MTAIYGLCCPISGELKYIGKANDSAARLSAHLRETRRGTPLYRWLAELRANGLAPEMFEIEQPKDWVEAERFWIAYFRSIGAQLLNLARGGNEPAPSREQRQKAARAASVARETGPNAKANKLLREMGQTVSWLTKEARRVGGMASFRLLGTAYKVRFLTKCLRAIL